MSKNEYPSFGRGNISTSMAQPPPFQKRKRGRPPKNAAGVICKSPDTNQPVAVKGKRGRPKGSKNKPKGIKTKVVTHGIIESNKAEINEAIELQRAHFPIDDEVTLRHRAEQFRPQKWKEGRWPDFAAVAKREAAEKAAAEAAAARAAEGEVMTATE
jgi:hypothetical protein